jgi:hypothetical protein
MISRNVTLAGLLAGGLLIVFQAGAQMGRGMGFCPGCYDSSNTAVIHGVVETVRNNASFCARGGTEVTLKTDKETYNVLLGPAAFLSQSNFAIAKGDELSVTGFHATFQGTPVLIAREVTKGERTLTLRDMQGYPAWGGRGMGPRSYGGGGWGCAGRGRGYGWR